MSGATDTFVAMYEAQEGGDAPEPTCAGCGCDCPCGLTLDPRLVEAAPELLAACEAIHAAGLAADEAAMDKALRAMHAAIAKARGEGVRA